MESTHTVSGPEDCGACVKPSFMALAELPLPEELPPPHAATAAATSVITPTSTARVRTGLG